MIEKINIAELLKGCPSGTPLDCTMYNNITLCGINEESETPIKIKRKDGITHNLTKYGQINHHEDAKCVIFPKGKTTWEGFVPPCVHKTNFKPFDKVLVRDNDACIWRADFYSHYEDGQHYYHICTGDGYKQCIPYNKETAHLVGTTNNCPDKYKTWKNEE